MFTYLKAETAVAQDLIDDSFSNFGFQMTFPWEGF